MVGELHRYIDGALDKRKHRLRDAVNRGDTTLQWELIAAAVEQGNIEHYKLKGKDAQNMRGRSRITYTRNNIDTWRRIEEDDDLKDLRARAQWLRTVINVHNELGNKLINIARRMKATCALDADADKRKINHMYNDNTINAYRKSAAHEAKRANLTETQKDQINNCWENKKKRVNCTDRDEQLAGEEDREDDEGDHVKEAQQFATEFQEMWGEAQDFDTRNIIHFAKIRRQGEKHIDRGRSIFQKLKLEISAVNRSRNTCKAKGVSNLARTIGGTKTGMLNCVERDRDIADGGKKGQITANPEDVDHIVQRAWKKSTMALTRGPSLTPLKSFLSGMPGSLSSARSSKLRGSRVTGSEKPS